MTFKKILLIILVIVVVAVVIFIAVVKIGFNDWMTGSINTGNEIIKSSLGDEFLIQYETYTMPDLETSIVIKNSQKKENIIHFVMGNKEYYKSELINVVDLPRIRCYQIYNQLLYRVDTNKFMGIDINDIEKAETQKNIVFVDVAKVLIDKKDWKWVKACGNFLLKAGDGDIRKILERYAKGQFTTEELEANKSSHIKKEDMVAFAKQILEPK